MNEYFDIITNIPMLLCSQDGGGHRHVQVSVLVTSQSADRSIHRLGEHSGVVAIGVEFATACDEPLNNMTPMQRNQGEVE